MNHDRVHELFSKASEAIVTEDGRVERRINNYETVIGNKEKEALYIPAGAVNDNYGNLNNYVTIVGRRVAKITLLRYTMYSTAFFVILGFSWSLLAILTPSTQSLIQDTALDAAALDERTASELQLERIANLIIRDGNWTDTRIALFLREWNRSTSDAREIFKTKAWYQHFSYRLNNKFRQEQEIGAFVDQDNMSSTHPIMKLALALGIADPQINYVASGTGEQQINELADEVAQELALVEQAKLAEQQEDSSNDSNISLNNLLKEKYAETSVSPDTKKQVVPAVSASTDRNPEEEQTFISEADVTRVLEKYKTAYELGDMQKLTSLFGVNDPESGKKILAQLKNNYEFVFANSNKRNVKFNRVSWRIQGNNAIVDSDYQASIELKNDKGVQSVNAKARIELQQSNRDITINRLELIDSKVNVVTPELNLVSVKKKPDAPTAAELQDVVTRLIGAYESGNIKLLTSLFAKDAKTNDRDGLKGIEDDYTKLFATTSERQMFVQGMEWSQDKNFAKGSGDLEAIIFAENGESVYTMKGKIQIVARRIDDKVLITHLYHIERSN